jgi:hypothetical protein
VSDVDKVLIKQLEAAAAELVATFEVQSPPIPIESMLQHPKGDMWEEVDISQLSGTFLSIKDHYSPRMSLARLLARHVITSSWATARSIPNILNDEALVRAFARMLIMPAEMVKALSSGARNPTAMSMHFEVPEEDARLRIQELAELE